MTFVRRKQAKCACGTPRSASNYLDVYIRRGLVPLAQPGDVLGVEAVGVVIDVGDGVTHVMPGDRVAYLGLPTGSYCELRNVSATQVVRMPREVSDEIAAAGFLKGLTAEYLLHRLHVLKPGEVVLVHAAAGGLGVMAASWARTLGATVIGTVSSEEKARLARDHGCHHVIVNSSYRFADAVLQASDGHGADLIVDGLGQQAAQEIYRHWQCLVTGSTSAWRAAALRQSIHICYFPRVRHFPHPRYCITPAMQNAFIR